MGLGGGLPGMGGSLGGLPGLGATGPLGGLGGLRPPMGGAAGAQNLHNALAALQAGGGLPGMPKLGGGLPGLRPGMPNFRPPGATAPAASMQTSKAGGIVGVPGATGGSFAKASAPPLTPGLVSAGSAAASSAPAPCTVYVGRISSEVSDEFVKQLLEKCGTVTKWNRAADPNTSKLTSFGFCDFEEPQGVWRALECLHEKQLCDKRLLVKCEEKAKQTIEEWKKTQKAQKTKEGIATGAAKEEGPLTDDKLEELLLEESKEVTDAIAKLLAEKNKGYPELGAENEKEDTKDEEKADKELENHDKENDQNKPNEEKADEKDKGKERKSEERGKKRTRSEEQRLEKEKEKEKEKKAAVSRNYRAPRRERDREQRVREKDRDVEKEYQFRIREFERNEQRRIQNLKRDLSDLDPKEPSERDIRKMTDRDLAFGDRERDEPEWKRLREDTARRRQKEKEQDNADRAQVQREADEIRKQKEKEEEEERLRLEKETEEKCRKEEEEEARRKKEEEDARRREKEKAEEERRRVENAEKMAKEAEERSRQEAAAAKLLLQVQEEMRNLDVEKAAAKGPVVTGTVHGPSGNDKDDGDDDRKPEARAPQTQASAAPSGPPDAKLKDDDMRRLISQVPTDKAKAFAFEIDWDVVHQSGIIEKKLRPWVRKKVTEFLGAEEQGMIEFIMRKVNSHTAPATILAELEGFIDEEAENFTLKMWRMLIFEVLRVKAR